jgi:hypothetical protein
MAHAPVFIHDIPSIHEKNPEMPQILGTIDLNRSIRAGDPLDYQEVRSATYTANALKALHGERKRQNPEGICNTYLCRSGSEQ